MKIHLTFLIIFLTLFGACKKKQNNHTLEISQLRRTYLHTQQKLLVDAAESCDSLYDQVGLFKNTAVYPTYFVARNRWISSYNSFLLLGPYRSGSTASAAFENEKNYLDLYPLNPAYLDYTLTNPGGGIIPDVTGYPAITGPNILSWNLQGGQENVSSGFHAIEFLLWGENGSRPFTDYIMNSDEIRDRRRDYLWSAMINLKLSVDKLAYTQDYENSILNMGTSDFMLRMLDGLRDFIVVDFAGKALKPSLNDQNNSRSINRFSNLSLESIKAKFKALKYAFNSSDLIDGYETDHYYLEDIIDDIEPERMEKIRASLADIESALAAINVTYAEALSNASYRSRLQTVVTQLEAIADELLAFKKNFE